MNVNKLIEIFKEEYKEITALNEPMMCFVDINEIKCLIDEIEHLQNLIDKTTNYYLKTLAKNGSMPDEAVEMFNLLEGNK